MTPFVIYRAVLRRRRLPGQTAEAVYMYTGGREGGR